MNKIAAYYVFALIICGVLAAGLFHIKAVDYIYLELVLKIAVLVYVIAILCMAVMAFNRRGTVSTDSFRLIFYGSVFFTLSDTMLAINKFIESIPLERLLVMGTYILAQFLIMKGILKQFSEVIEPG